MFHASADNIDDLMRAVFTRMLSENRDNNRVEAIEGNSTEVFWSVTSANQPSWSFGK